MKKLILIFIIVLFSSSAYGQSFADAFKFGKKKTGDAIEKITGTKRCQITADTPLKEVHRPPFEVGVRWNFGDFPSNGQAQFRIENVDMTVIGNLGPTFHWYSWVGTRTTDKTEYEYANEANAYDRKWQSSMIFVGFGLYLLPTFRIFAGAGQISLENAAGHEPDLATANEVGFAWSKMWYGNRVEVMYRVIDAPIAGKNISIQKAPADGSFNSISIGLFFPLGD